jgi:hypothetical protein
MNQNDRDEIQRALCRCAVSLSIVAARLRRRGETGKAAAIEDTAAGIAAQWQRLK